MARLAEIMAQPALQPRPYWGHFTVITSPAAHLPAPRMRIRGLELMARRRFGIHGWYNRPMSAKLLCKGTPPLRFDLP